MDKLKVGQEWTKTFKVYDADTAASMGSGGLPVLATPRLTAWMEGLAFEMTREYLDTNQSTVGSDMHCRHLAPTGLLRKVNIVCRLTELEGKRLVFNMEARDETGSLLAEAEHTRFVIDVERFLEKLNKNN